jgi:uncharacterized protein with FMN-binding domain/ferredoxin
MKNLQKTRLYVQLLCIVLTALGVFTDIKITMMIIMAATILAGAYYCGWICPFGTIQDILSKMGKKLKIRKYKMPKTVQYYLKFSRYIIFALFTFTGLDIMFTLFSYDPRSNLLALLQGNVINTSLIAVMISFGLIAMFFERPFCNYLCIEGAKYGLISSLRPVSIKRNESTCVDCKKCDKACPMNIEVSSKENLKSLQCINCFQCISACPVDNTLTFGNIGLNKMKKKPIPAAAVIIVAVAVMAGIYFVGKDDTIDFNAGKNGEIETAVESTTETVSYGEGSSALELEANERGYLGDAKGIDDGVYLGTGVGFKGKMTVELAVIDQQISSVEVVDHRDDKRWFNRAYNIIPDLIVENQTTEVNVVSGATYSSQGIIEGAENALEQAKEE